MTTGPKITSTSTAEPIYGKATKGAIAVWEAPGAAKLAGLAKDDGSYVIPVASARSADLSASFTLTDGGTETISILDGTGAVATINCVSGKDKPLPTVTAGQTVTCGETPTANQTTGQGQTSATTGGAGFSPTPAAQTPSGVQVNISEGQTVSTGLPVISGKAGARQMVKIVVHSSTPYSSTVIAGPDGSWSWTPPASLTPGAHTVTITVVNADGTQQTVTRNFTVQSGSPILPITSGTPSATLSHLACVNFACVSVDGAGSDSCTTNSQCATPSATVATPAATTPTVSQTPPPSTGAVENTLLLLTLGLGLITLSMGMIFFYGTNN